MRITQINTSDSGGGAANIAFNLHNKYLQRWHDSTLVVSLKETNNPTVHQISKTGWKRFWFEIDKKLLNSHAKGAYRLHNLIKIIKSPLEETAHALGVENYYYPEARHCVEQLIPQTDVFHLHNLHYDYFDLRLLPILSKEKPVLITLHDEYLYTGLCASTFGCERWRPGCGDCPQLDNYPDFKRDSTHYNWRRKKAIFSKSQVTLATPSKWLAQRAKESFLSHLPVKVIPNGVDLTVFTPGSKAPARQNLGLDQDAFIITSTCKAGRPGKYKDREMLDRVIGRLREKDVKKQIIIVKLGSRSNSKETNDHFCLVEKTFVESPQKLAEFFQASDLYIHTADAETFGLAVCEAMACGVPVVSTNAGGIPELVSDGETGYTVPIGDDQQMVTRIIDLMEHEEVLEVMGKKASEIVQANYSLEQMVDNYMDLYQELIIDRKL